MIPLRVILDGDNWFPDLVEKGFVRGELVAVARLPVSTSGGRSTVAFRIELPDGRTVLAETTLRLLQTAIKAIEAREEMERTNVAHH